MTEITFQQEIPGLFAQEALRQKEFSMTNRHFHESLELYFMLEGERYYFVEQDFYHIRTGMAILINRSQIHKSSMINGSQGHRRFLLQLDASILDHYFSLPDIPSLQSLGENYWGTAEFSPADWKLVLCLIGLIKTEMSRRTLEGNSMGLLLAMQLVTVFVRARKDQEITARSNQLSGHKVRTGMYHKIHEITLYLQNHCSDPCPLDDIAARFYISRSYLTRIFKSVTGFTVTEYLTVCRIRKAKALLTKTDLSITEIAAQTGFGNITYFEKIFKRMTEYTPLQYRKSARTTVNALL